MEGRGRWAVGRDMTGAQERGPVRAGGGEREVVPHHDRRVTGVRPVRGRNPVAE
ncbi:hypothetical protein Scel_64960 [Streptomyces cellostaticus]|nr:hypothetical protein Scel_64960 [Streptomyces cellostaticus]